MNRALNFLPTLLAATAERPDLAGLSDWELINQHPILARLAVALRLLGFIAALYLWWRYISTRRVAGQSPAAILSLAPPPWAGQGLQLAVIALLAAMLSDGLLFAALAGDGLFLSPPPLIGVIVMRLTILGAVLVYLRPARRGRTPTGPPTNPLKAVAVGSMFYLAALPAVEALILLTAVLLRAAGIELTAQPMVEQLIGSVSRAVVWLVIALAVVIAPVFEEIMFRGLAYPALKQRWGAAPALFFVSALFALTHLHLPSIGPLFALGVGLGLAYEISGSLLAPITMHALFNAVNVGMLLYVRGHP